MNKTKTFAICSLLAISWLTSSQASARDFVHTCSLRALAGQWTYITNVGQILPFNNASATSIGTYSIDNEGNVSGEFDVTFAGIRFESGVTFSGKIEVDSDCRGTTTFTTETGITRVNSVIILNRNEMRAMSQDPNVLWLTHSYRLPRF